MNISTWYNKHLPLFEFALRIYVAYYLVDYGCVKLTGGMFNNASPQILITELQKVDLFHLTWYFFHRITILTYTIGICQLLSAALLLFNNTVLWGCALAIPIFLNIILIDISVFSDNVLAIRVTLYLVCILMFVWYRRTSLIQAYKVLVENKRVLSNRKLSYYATVPVLLLLYLALEIAITRLFSHVF